MENACTAIAESALKLKKQYRAVLAASPAYGSDTRMTREIDTLGLLLKELEDAVVLLHLKLSERAAGEVEP
jgi:hypothetical protein